jgi:hypothetical protein
MFLCREELCRCCCVDQANGIFVEMEGSKSEATRTEIPNLDLSIITAVETVDVEVKPPSFSSPKPSKEPKLRQSLSATENHENGEKSLPENDDDKPVNKMRPLTKKEEETAKFVNFLTLPPPHQ